MNDITPQQAREQLAQVEAATDRRAADRRVHALATAGFGLAMGAYLSVYRVVDGTGWQTPALLAYVFGLLALAGWQTRAARSWPRNARRASYLGLGATVVLFMAAVMTFNYREAQRELDGTGAGESVLLLVLAGMVTAAPMVVAALRIRRSTGE